VSHRTFVTALAGRASRFISSQVVPSTLSGRREFITVMT
jgi:hypothetical protein